MLMYLWQHYPELLMGASVPFVVGLVWIMIKRATKRIVEVTSDGITISSAANGTQKRKFNGKAKAEDSDRKDAHSSDGGLI